MIILLLIILILLFNKNYEKFTEKKITEKKNFTDKSLDYIKYINFDNNSYSLPSSDINKFSKYNYPIVFGTLELEGLKKIIDQINIFKGTKWIRNKIFLDLGSGDGRVNIWSLLFNFKKSIGIEYSKKRHNNAIVNKKKLDIDDQKKIQFINKYLFNYNMKNVDVIYISSYAFTKEMKTNLIDKFNKELKKHSLIFTTRKFIDDNLKLISKFYVNQSWDKKSEIHFYEKT